MIKIDTDVLPDAITERNGKYPWKQMAVGESFLVEVADGKRVNSIRSGAQRMARILGHRFVTRREGAGLRVWRVT